MGLDCTGSRRAGRSAGPDRRAFVLALAGGLAACSRDRHVGPPIIGVKARFVATFDSPWGLLILPDQRMLVTERTYASDRPQPMWLVDQHGRKQMVAGVPQPNVGLLDIKLHPDHARTRRIALSFLEPGANDRRVGRDKEDATRAPFGLAMAFARLEIGDGAPRLEDVRIVWRQTPKIVSFPGSGEPGGRLAFSPDGAFLFIAAGDRQEFDPVQQIDNTLGKVVRLTAEGAVPPDNPNVGRADARSEIWSIGHRNPYGLAFDRDGRLWEVEHGPAGGDELNLIRKLGNYGWPNVSFGSAYTGQKYPDPKEGDGSVLPLLHWTPAIAPSSLLIYSGTLFGAWRDDAIIGGLASEALIRIDISGKQPVERQRIAMDARIRAVEEASDGAIWVLEDAPTGRLLRLTPSFARSA